MTTEFDAVRALLAKTEEVWVRDRRTDKVVIKDQEAYIVSLEARVKELETRLMAAQLELGAA
jgi:hypothetical protein